MATFTEFEESLEQVEEVILWHFHQDNPDGVIYLVGALEVTPSCPDPGRPEIVDGKVNEGHCVRVMVENITVVSSVDPTGYPRPGDPEIAREILSSVGENITERLRKGNEVAEGHGLTVHSDSKV